jgi:hypothetical protein
MDTAQTAPSFEHDIKPMFREHDHQEMEFLLDLWDFQDVKDNADDILVQVSSGRMPCDDAWPEERVTLFRRWVETGMRE